MKLKAEYLVLLMSLFLGVVFLDQNRTSVPIKLILGSPFQMELSSIILLSAVSGACIAFGGLVVFKRYRQNKSQ